MENTKPGDKEVFEGLAEINPHGNWSDVDHGLYVGGERFCDRYGVLDKYCGKHIRVTVEVLPRPEEPKEE